VWGQVVDPIVKIQHVDASNHRLGRSLTEQANERFSHLCVRSKNAQSVECIHKPPREKYVGVGDRFSTVRNLYTNTHMCYICYIDPVTVTLIQSNHVKFNVDLFMVPIILLISWIMKLISRLFFFVYMENKHKIVSSWKKKERTRMAFVEERRKIIVESLWYFLCVW